MHMQYRKLGKSSLKVSVIGVGAEHLKKVPTREITEIFRFALEQGINYFDLVWSFSNIVTGLSEALKGQNAKAVVAFHLRSCISNGEYKRSRDPAECEKHLRIQLDQLNMDSAPVLNIHYVPNIKVWRDLNRKGIVSLAVKLKEQGLAEAISVSTHEPEVVSSAARSGVIDSIMHQVSVANHMYMARNKALQVCSELGVGVVAMKPFAGGELLRAGQRVKIPAYKTGWKTMTLDVPLNSTPVKLLSYTLSQPGVCTAVTGVTSFKELAANLVYLTASKDDKDYGQIIGNLEKQAAV